MLNVSIGYVLMCFFAVGSLSMSGNRSSSRIVLWRGYFAKTLLRTEMAVIWSEFTRDRVPAETPLEGERVKVDRAAVQSARSCASERGASTTSLFKPSSSAAVGEMRSCREGRKSAGVRGT